VLTGQLADLPTMLPDFDAWAGLAVDPSDGAVDELTEWDAVVAAATAELMAEQASVDVDTWDVDAMTWDQAIAALPNEEVLVSPIADTNPQVAFDPVFTPVVDPVSQPVEQPVSQPISQPVEQPIAPSLSMARREATPSVSSTPMMRDPMALPEENDEDSTVRVSVRQLNQLNDLFGELAIERNGLDLYLKRLSGLMGVLGERVKQLDQTNVSVRTLYDRTASGNRSGNPANENSNTNSNTNSNANGSTALRLGAYSEPAGLETLKPGELNQPENPDFDDLEMDRYSELHSLSQQIMETVVQIQEVTSDLDLSIDDATQTTRNLNKTAKQLQSKLTQLRMRPLGDVTDRFPRALREMALQYGKRVKLQVVGSNLLIDRNILEALNDPLMHLLRNAFDHGIETPDARRAIGKPEEGVITIEAIHRGNRTEIYVRDDGGGIPLHKVRSRAAQMGLDASLLATASEADLLSLIFEPGFSTSDSVTTMSGRGVGMDVVRDNLKQIRGEISVNTQSGIGTTFTLSLPYTLSIVRILLAEAQGMMLGLPNDAIESVMLFQPELLVMNGTQEQVQMGSERLPLIRLGEWLHFNCARQPQSLESTPTLNAPTLLVTRRGVEKIALLIDRCWGEQEVALRRIEAPLVLPPGFSGCTILGDGRVVPLANLNELLHWISTYGARQSDRPNMPVSNLMPVRSAAKSTVLIVDDSINVRRYLALTLERAGYRIEQAKDGQDAVEKLENGLAVSAVICDIEMPRLDGFGVLNRLRSNADLRHLPVALLTSRSGDKYRKLATSLGAAAYLTKPYSEQDLLNTLQQMLTLVPV
jgi:two-component system, chemotaxis family, sensor histidine kinase and response regulator PixL